MENSISMKELLGIWIKRWKLIVILTFLMGVVSGTVTYFLLTPKYEASTQILVNQKDTMAQFDPSQMRGNVELINTYSVIIKSPVILEKVIEKLKLSQNVEELNRNIVVNSEAESQVFSITVSDSKPERAVKIVNTISDTFQQDIKSIMNVDNVNILAKAELKEDPIPVSPKPLINIAIGIIFGMMVGVGLALLIEYLDNSLESVDEIEAYLGLPVLGSIQKIPKKKGRPRAKSKRTGVDIIEPQVKG
ncbi:putative capsular polysaccharide biosynthesis protein YwqC [Robertmurraya siralis]|uniref:Capsular polysaccharide biosynthesis protein YwqC n=1 Tax=Robertmurraya siralis TaxID=77777 RepID=A0A919WHW9_9BACI|nr:Wzz/FepE/Etk N-terminal domain-containing protein [Robertmurraya siralis]GIN62011.1 putative capsular polysaccharide biosynthesis protein YwqC [Robertmurraya siralis]